ncbi:hypothetical protein EJ06DRAFT_539382 [Trichodelitschia bisporula]|uniref:CAP-Gly domain-containing protein n=1 Tax=Trichodelitschia bisporula TaxID=703511 RepID=A0A6G1HNH7_9PEZI|nr:hypothetical protein EJ06DRAFT_539382 [Trichodelitschia bisporula]
MAGGDGREIEAGDAVDVPGGMHGVVKFVGSVRGKKGVFAGVELSREYASRGKNDGDVDGVRYFTTSVAGSGIFLPLHRATKRVTSPALTGDTYPPSPSTPYNDFAPDAPKSYQSPTHAPPKFSQSVGPGARPPSPLFKAKQRPSLPRPESPLRKPPTLAPTPGRASFGGNPLSRSQLGAPRYTPSPAPKMPPKSRTPVPPRPYSRSNSRANSRLGFSSSIDESADTTPTAKQNPARSSDGSAAGSGVSSGSGFTPVARRAADDKGEEVNRLRKMLQERDRQLKEQATSLAEMESSLSELQSLIPSEAGFAAHMRSRSGSSYEDNDTAGLRAIIREKNEKISMLTAEFDAHRADFRSTIDTLEMASSETERVYEKRVEELLQEVRELQERGMDVDSVALQLKQLEEQVQELEEGLEDARRGEAEARGEVEFLRGEVERSRSELKREKEKAAAALKNAAPAGAPAAGTDARDLEQRDDEIRGLKAIIHSLSSGGAVPALDAPPSDDMERLSAAVERLEKEKKDLQQVLERKAQREEELERDIERLTAAADAPAHRASVLSSGGFSDRTATALERRNSARDSKGTVVGGAWRGGVGTALAPMAEAENASVTDAPSTAGSGVLWCEICEQGGHDILSCASIDARREERPRPLQLGGKLPPLPGAAPTAPLPTPLGGVAGAGNGGVGVGTGVSAVYDASVIAGKDGSRDPNKWCALCERDGHDSINCAFEDEF